MRSWERLWKWLCEVLVRVGHTILEHVRHAAHEENRLSFLYTQTREHLVTEVDRADEAAQKILSPAQQQQLLRAHVNFEKSADRSVLQSTKKWALSPRCGALGETSFPLSPVRSTTNATWQGPQPPFPKCCRFNQVCDIDTMDAKNLSNKENPIASSFSAPITTYHHRGER